MQARTGTLVSGSFALQFFDRGFYEGSDLDLYCTYRAGDHGLGRWLLAEGYTFVPFRGQKATFLEVLEEDEDDSEVENAAEDVRAPPPLHHVYDEKEDRGIKTVCTFHKLNKKTGEVLQVQIIFTMDSPMEVIMGFHSSTFNHSVLPTMQTLTSTVIQPLL